MVRDLYFLSLLTEYTHTPRYYDKASRLHTQRCKFLGEILLAETVGFPTLNWKIPEIWPPHFDTLSTGVLRSVSACPNPMNLLNLSSSF